jgi:thiol:disulfide interchange protein
MKFISLLALLFTLTWASDTQAVSTTPAGYVFVDVNPNNGALEAALRKAAVSARAQGLTLYIELTTDWCVHCKRLMNAMRDPAMTDAYNGTYIAHIDGDIWAAKLRKMGFKFRGVPTIFAVDTRGRWAGKAIDCGEWNEDVTAEMAETLKQFFTDNAWMAPAHQPIRRS